MKQRSRKDDVAARILRAKGNPQELDKIMQDECRRRASRKLAATLLSAPGFRFPTELSTEQCTADDVASFHASLIPQGSRVVDLTCGLCIDAFHVARRAASVHCLELNPAVAEVIGHNASELGLHNVSSECCDCVGWLAENSGRRHFDIAFIDPARRAADGSRLFSLRQCQPDVIELLPLIRTVADRLIIKVSPMLDIAKTIAEVGEVAGIYAVGTRGECKELLVDVRFGYEGDAAVRAVIVEPDGAAVIDMPAGADVTFASELNVGDRVGEPWPCVMKTMAYRRLKGEQLHPSTFLFRNPPSDFPGNVYQVVRVEAFSSSTLRRLAREDVTASVATRNFPLSADELRKRLKARESSDMRLIATTLCPNVQILVYLVPNFADFS